MYYGRDTAGKMTPGERGGGSNTYFPAKNLSVSEGDTVEIHISGNVSSFWVNGVDAGIAHTTATRAANTKHGIAAGNITGTVSHDNFSVKSA
jgi:hypothetical protein